MHRDYERPAVGWHVAHLADHIEAFVLTIANLMRRELFTIGSSFVAADVRLPGELPNRCVLVKYERIELRIEFDVCAFVRLCSEVAFEELRELLPGRGCGKFRFGRGKLLPSRRPRLGIAHVV